MSEPASAVTTRRQGVALVAALLTLSAVALLALASVLLVSLDLRLAANRQELALARADSRSRLTLALLELEAASGSGVLPQSPPQAGGQTDYRRLSDQVAILSVFGRAGTGSYRSDARVELREEDSAWRLHVVQRR